MGLLDNIKNDAKKSSGSKSKIFYVKDGDKRRVRFLQDMEDGFEVPFHDSFEANINVPCRSVYGEDCPYCEDESLRTRTQYAWSVWDYEAKEVKILMYPMNNCTPIGTIAAMYENYGTLLDRDYMISRNGKQQNTQYSVIPMDKNKFRNEKAKPLSEKAFLKLLSEAFPDDAADKAEKGSSKKTSTKSKKEEIDDEDEDLDWKEADDEEVTDYSEMSAKELYNLCKKREIECEPKKPSKYYINLLEEDDKAHDDWDDEEESDEEDDWEE